MYHFKVSEERDDDTVSFSIKPLTLKNEDAINREFKGRLENIKNKLNQDGGKHRSKKHSISDSSDSSDSSISISNTGNLFILFCFMSSLEGGLRRVTRITSLNPSSRREN
jgi:hypothetical protein